MVRPHSFRKNEETATNNHYQRDLAEASPEEIIERAQGEFDGLVEQLEAAGVNVVVFDEAEPHATPDALFPNNWISTHADGTVALYPMFAPNRRAERREDVPLVLEHQFGFDVRQIIDFTEFESHGKFLEGTGSIVLDRINRKAYAALSERTDARALAKRLASVQKIRSGRHSTSVGRYLPCFREALPAKCCRVHRFLDRLCPQEAVLPAPAGAS